MIEDFGVTPESSFLDPESIFKELSDLKNYIELSHQDTINAFINYFHNNDEFNFVVPNLKELQEIAENLYLNKSPATIQGRRLSRTDTMIRLQEIISSLKVKEAATDASIEKDPEKLKNIKENLETATNYLERLQDDLNFFTKGCEVFINAEREWREINIAANDLEVLWNRSRSADEFDIDKKRINSRKLKLDTIESLEQYQQKLIVGLGTEINIEEPMNVAKKFRDYIDIRLTTWKANHVANNNFMQVLLKDGNYVPESGLQAEINVLFETLYNKFNPNLVSDKEDPKLAQLKSQIKNISDHLRREIVAKLFETKTMILLKKTENILANEKIKSTLLEPDKDRSLVNKIISQYEAKIEEKTLMPLEEQQKLFSELKPLSEELILRWDENQTWIDNQLGIKNKNIINLSEFISFFTQSSRKEKESDNSPVANKISKELLVEAFEAFIKNCSTLHHNFRNRFLDLFIVKNTVCTIIEILAKRNSQSLQNLLICQDISKQISSLTASLSENIAKACEQFNNALNLLSEAQRYKSVLITTRQNVVVENDDWGTQVSIVLKDKDKNSEIYKTYSVLLNRCLNVFDQLDNSNILISEVDIQLNQWLSEKSKLADYLQSLGEHVEKIKAIGESLKALDVYKIDSKQYVTFCELQEDIRRIHFQADNCLNFLNNFRAERHFTVEQIALMKRLEAASQNIKTKCQQVAQISVDIENKINLAIVEVHNKTKAENDKVQQKISQLKTDLAEELINQPNLRWQAFSDSKYGFRTGYNYQNFKLNADNVAKLKFYFESFEIFFNSLMPDNMSKDESIKLMVGYINGQISFAQIKERINFSNTTLQNNLQLLLILKPGFPDAVNANINQLEKENKSLSDNKEKLLNLLSSGRDYFIKLQCEYLLMQWQAYTHEIDVNLESLEEKLRNRAIFETNALNNEWQTEFINNVLACEENLLDETFFNEKKKLSLPEFIKQLQVFVDLDENAKKQSGKNKSASRLVMDKEWFNETRMLSNYCKQAEKRAIEKFNQYLIKLKLNANLQEIKNQYAGKIKIQQEELAELFKKFQNGQYSFEKFLKDYKRYFNDTDIKNGNFSLLKAIPLNEERSLLVENANQLIANALKAIEEINKRSLPENRAILEKTHKSLSKIQKEFSEQQQDVKNELEEKGINLIKAYIENTYTDIRTYQVQMKSLVSLEGLAPEATLQQKIDAICKLNFVNKYERLADINKLFEQEVDAVDYPFFINADVQKFNEQLTELTALPASFFNSLAGLPKQIEQSLENDIRDLNELRKTLNRNVTGCLDNLRHSVEQLETASDEFAQRVSALQEQNLNQLTGAFLKPLASQIDIARLAQYMDKILSKEREKMAADMESLKILPVNIDVIITNFITDKRLQQYSSITKSISALQSLAKTYPQVPVREFESSLTPIKNKFEQQEKLLLDSIERYINAQLAKEFSTQRIPVFIASIERKLFSFGTQAENANDLVNKYEQQIENLKTDTAAQANVDKIKLAARLQQLKEYFTKQFAQDADLLFDTNLKPIDRVEQMKQSLKQIKELKDFINEEKFKELQEKLDELNQQVTEYLLSFESNKKKILKLHAEALQFFGIEAEQTVSNTAKKTNKNIKNPSSVSEGTPGSFNRLKPVKLFDTKKWEEDEAKSLVEEIKKKPEDHLFKIDFETLEDALNLEEAELEQLQTESGLPQRASTGQTFYLKADKPDLSTMRAVLRRKDAEPSEDEDENNPVYLQRLMKTSIDMISAIAAVSDSLTLNGSEKSMILVGLFYALKLKELGLSNLNVNYKSSYGQMFNFQSFKDLANQLENNDALKNKFDSKTYKQAWDFFTTFDQYQCKNNYENLTESAFYKKALELHQPEPVNKFTVSSI